LLGFRSVVKNPYFISSHNGVQKLISFMCVHLLRWEIVWRNAPRIWRDFGPALPFQTRLTQTKPVLLLSNEHGSQVDTYEVTRRHIPARRFVTPVMHAVKYRYLEVNGTADVAAKNRKPRTTQITTIYITCD
jgi:hypothetical protein